MVHKNLPCKYFGVTHEYIDLQGATANALPGLVFIDHAMGSNRVENYERDVCLSVRNLVGQVILTRPRLDSWSQRLPKPRAACHPLITAHNCACLLTRTCCSTTRCGLLRERGTTALMRTRMTSCVLLMAWSPT